MFLVDTSVRSSDKVKRLPKASAVSPAPKAGSRAPKSPCSAHPAPAGYDPLTDADLLCVRGWLHQADTTGALFTASIQTALKTVLTGFGVTSIAQLSKTEKTVLGPFVENRLRADFKLTKSENKTLDYDIGGVRIDCKFSISALGWMIPTEAHGKPCLVVSCDGNTFSAGLLRAYDDYLGSPNQDGKRSVRSGAGSVVIWLYRNRILPAFSPVTGVAVTPVTGVAVTPVTGTTCPTCAPTTATSIPKPSAQCYS